MIEKIFTCIANAATSKSKKTIAHELEILIWVPEKNFLEIDGEFPIQIIGLTEDKLEDCLELIAIYRPVISDYERLGNKNIFRIKMKNPERRQIGFLIGRTG
jgi:hypothetical protein